MNLKSDRGPVLKILKRFPSDLLHVRRPAGGAGPVRLLLCTVRGKGERTHTELASVGHHRERPKDDHRTQRLLLVGGTGWELPTRPQKSLSLSKRKKKDPHTSSRGEKKKSKRHQQGRGRPREEESIPKNAESTFFLKTELAASLCSDRDAS